MYFPCFSGRKKEQNRQTVIGNFLSKHYTLITNQRSGSKDDRCPPSFEPDGFDCLRDTFIGSYRTERNPQVVESGACSGSFEKGGNHCAYLKKEIVLQPGEEVRLIYLLGKGRLPEAIATKEKYTEARVDDDFRRLADFWDRKTFCPADSS